MDHRTQSALDLITKLLGGDAPDHRAHVDARLDDRIRRARQAPPLDWPGLVISFPSRATPAQIKLHAADTHALAPQLSEPGL
ncbi:hypothetical protein ACQR10_04380 [Bradyrhizobium sp. HKCCYLRH2060]|uniref:hypothetical protein n=1 Tax=Bradyrhizobium sp. HKCCYLRH2060 TaxID=3420743 RepID=UPI003EC0FBD7